MFVVNLFGIEYNRYSEDISMRDIYEGKRRKKILIIGKE